MIVLWLLLAWNGFTVSLMAWDKHCAVSGKRRVRERTLLLCAFFMGAAGILLGMSFCRHKTKHIKFQLLVPLALLVQFVMVFIAAQVVPVW